MAIAVLLGFQNCVPDPDPYKLTVTTNDFDFKAINLTVDNGKYSATGILGTVNKTESITSNGETTTFDETKKSNELPVRVGDEIAIQFTPSCPEQTEAYFIMPDNTTYKVTAKAPTFKWVVPDKSTIGRRITGETHYETENCIYNRTGAITLVALE